MLRTPEITTWCPAVEGSGEEPMVRLPAGQGEGMQHEAVAQQGVLGQQIGVTSALLGGLPIGTGQHGTI